MRQSYLTCVLLASALQLAAQTYPGTNAPNTASPYAVPVGAAATNLSFSVNGGASAYSYVLVRKGSPPTDTSYDFSSQLTGQPNAVHLDQLDVSAGTYYVRVKTPAGSATHAFSLVVETNRTDLRTSARPVSKSISGFASGLITAGAYQYFRLELTANTPWRVRLDATNHSAPDLYVHRGQLPTDTTYLKRSLSLTNDLIAFSSTEGLAGSYYLGVHGATAPAGGVRYTLQIASNNVANLTWDPGLTHEGTQIVTNGSGLAEDYYFRINTANPSYGAWRTALRVTNGEAHVYLSRGTLPTPAQADFKSERVGPDGFVLAATTQFLPSEDWFILVRAQAGALWQLVSGSPFVTDLGTVAADGSTGSGSVEIGPEGLRFFSASAPADMLAWRLWLNGATNTILVKKTSVPLPGTSEQAQPSQMLVVPPYLTAAQYLIGIAGSPGSQVNLDSRQHAVLDLAYDSGAETNVTGFGYTTYRVTVPAQQIAWRMYLPSTNGNPNIAVRRNNVPNENNNDAYSEQPLGTTDQIMLVPPVLSDGTFYITVYGTNAHHFALQNGPAIVTDLPYINPGVLNNDPTRVGWRYYRVSDINQQLGTLGWDLLLSNAVPGTRIALRKNAAPSTWTLRNPNSSSINYYDVLSTGDFLQRPAHQAEVWYIGIYNPTNALGPFTLITRELEATPLSDNVAVTRTNVLSGRWEFFRVQLTAEDVQGTVGPGPVLGWDVRLVNVASGLPRIVIRRESLPATLTTTITPGGSVWPNGGQWAAGYDWTHRSYSVNGSVNEDGRVLGMGTGRPLEPGTYYIGVLNSTGTNAMTYSVLSRWIGPARTIDVPELAWSGGIVTNTLPAREVGFYRVVMPPNQPSWKVRMTPLQGEAMLIAATNRMPNVDSEKRMQKSGKEHYVLLPGANSTTLVPGTNYLAIVSEGVTTNATAIGSGQSTVRLETLGHMPETHLGLLTTNDLVSFASLEGGESTAYHFDTALGTLGFWLMLEDKVGNPWMVSRGDPDLADPGLGGDTYGNEGGETSRAVAGSQIITVADPYSTETVMLKARGTAGAYPDASYTLRIKEIVPEPLAFDGGIGGITNQPVEQDAYFQVDVPTNALGWDIRLTNITSGSATLVVRRDFLPISTTSYGFPQSSPGSVHYLALGRLLGRRRGLDGTKLLRRRPPGGRSNSGDGDGSSLGAWPLLRRNSCLRLHPGHLQPGEPRHRTGLCHPSPGPGLFGRRSDRHKPLAPGSRVFPRSNPHQCPKLESPTPGFDRRSAAHRAPGSPAQRRRHPGRVGHQFRRQENAAGRQREFPPPPTAWKGGSYTGRLLPGRGRRRPIHHEPKPHRRRYQHLHREEPRRRPGCQSRRCGHGGTRGHQRPPGW